MKGRHENNDGELSRCGNGERKGGEDGTGSHNQLAPGMKARECGVDHIRSLPADVQQHEAAVGEELVRAQCVLRALSPRAVCELVEIGVGRDEEELLVVDPGRFVSSDVGDLSGVAAPRRVAKGGGRRLVVEMGWHSWLLSSGCRRIDRLDGF